MVVGDDSYSKGRAFKSRHRDGQFFILICCKIVCLKRPKIKCVSIKEETYLNIVHKN